MLCLGPEYPTDGLKSWKIGWVALIMALDHHEHRLHIIKDLSQLDQWHHIILRSVQSGAPRWAYVVSSLYNLSQKPQDMPQWSHKYFQSFNESQMHVHPQVHQVRSRSSCLYISLLPNCPIFSQIKGGTWIKVGSPCEVNNKANHSL